MDLWHFNDSGQQRGPVTAEAIKSLLESRKLPADTLIWSEGMVEWKPANSISEFQLSPYASPTFTSGSETDWSGYLPSGPQVRPWVRYWARTFDFLLFALIFGGAAAMVWPEFVEMNDTLLGILLLVGYNFVEPALFAALGTTPFKALLRVRVRNNDGTKLSYQRALRRTFSIWLRGQGLGVPLIALFTSITSYSRLTRDSITWWDRDGGFTVTHQTVAWWRWLLLIALLGGFIALMTLGSEA